MKDTTAFSPEVMAKVGQLRESLLAEVRRDVARRLQEQNIPVTETSELLGVTRQAGHKHLKS